jgi:hypothetical protein
MDINDYLLFWSLYGSNMKGHDETIQNGFDVYGIRVRAKPIDNKTGI